jgi:hypothetical protein
MDVRHRGNRQNGVQLLCRDNTPERSDVLAVIPDAEQTPALMVRGERMRMHFRWDREGGSTAADDKEVHRPSASDPSVAEVRDDTLGATA